MNALKNSALVLASIVLTLLVLEFAFTAFFLPDLPLKFHGNFRSIGYLAQANKTESVPQDYVMLLGDSFAHGAGDWVASIDPNGNPHYNSAHVFHDLTGRDVLNFGWSGAGSLDALITGPVRHFETINANLWFDLPTPQAIVVYFYEGNDLNNNAVDTFAGQYGYKTDLYVTGDKYRFMDRERFDAEIVPERLHAARRYMTRANFPFKRAFPLTAGIASIAREQVRLVTGVADAPAVGRQSMQTGAQHRWLSNTTGPNRLDVGGRTVFAPAFQPPAPLLNDRDTALGVAMFGHSLDFLKRYFPDSRVVVYYLPSTAVSYRYNAPAATVQLQVPGREERTFPVTHLEARSNALCPMVQAAVEVQHATFIDIRNAILDKTATTILHGAADYSHFDRLGYEYLGKLVAESWSGGSRPCQDISLVSPP